MKYIIEKSMSSKVLMAGNYYKHHHPGGISAVVQYWSENIEDLQYYATWKLGGTATRAWWFGKSFVEIIFRLLTDKKIRIVHLHFAADGSFWRKEKLLRMAKMFGKKVVMHCHASRFKDFYSEQSEDGKRHIVDTLNKADVLIALSESWKEWFISVGVVASKIVVLHNITAEPQERLACKVNDGKVHMLFMGELGKRKGVFDIIRGLAKHRDELEGKLEFRIGGNTNEDRLMREIEEGGLQNIVKFEGWVAGEKKIDLLNWADLFILPSFNEGLPISILEAMSYKMPIISSPVGGIPEVVKDGVNGAIVTPGNDDEIFAAIKKYVDDRTLLSTHGEESFKVVQTYLPNFVMNHLKRIYEGLIKNLEQENTAYIGR